LVAATSEPEKAWSAPGPIEVTTAAISPYCQPSWVAAWAIATSLRNWKVRTTPAAS
jgi:hypothetical protein